MTDHNKEYRDFNTEQLEAYYSSMPRQGRYCTRCVMALPENLEATRVLDLECRKGKGAYGIADRVGAEGFVVGVDSSAANIANAIEFAPKSHWAKGNWERYLSFSQGYFEDLASAGIDDESFDIVIANSSLNLALDRKKAFSEIYRVLKPGGLLYHSCVFAESSLPSEVVETLTGTGNVFSAAPTRQQYQAFIEENGFSRCLIEWGKSAFPAENDDVPELLDLYFTDAVAQSFK